MSASKERQGSGPARIDLNADLGEGFANDRALLALVTSASICCGAHAGSPDVIRMTLRHAAAHRVTVGAHPGYPDRAGFGRREREHAGSELVGLIVSQVAAFIKLARELKVAVAYIKPHGALYNQAQRQPDVAAAVIAAAQTFDLPLLGLPGSQLDAASRKARLAYFAEGFPDRRYRADGSLVPRSEPLAILSDPAEIEAQIVRLVGEGRVATLCIHGDEPQAVANAELARRVLTRHGIAVRPFLGESP
jgi:5-oxoprolinase (ATP-hydrolysing) subunit A